jgi:hypothetical protein
VAALFVALTVPRIGNHPTAPLAHSTSGETARGAVEETIAVSNAGYADYTDQSKFEQWVKYYVAADSQPPVLAAWQSQAEQPSGWTLLGYMVGNFGCGQTTVTVIDSLDLPKEGTVVVATPWHLVWESGVWRITSPLEVPTVLTSSTPLPAGFSAPPVATTPTVAGSGC